MDIVRTLTFRSPERKIVGVLIVKFLEHQQRNVNLQKGRLGGGRPAPSLMIKSETNTERKKRIGAVRIAYLPK